MIKICTKKMLDNCNKLPKISSKNARYGDNIKYTTQYVEIRRKQRSALSSRAERFFILAYTSIHYVFTKMAYNMSIVPAGAI